LKPYRLSILELAVVKEGSTPADAFNESATLAQHAEAWGYKRFWLAEHHNMISVASTATTVLIAHIASVTKHIRVGSGGVMLPNHSPLVVAEQFGTLGTLYQGRIDMGLGRAPGTDQVTAKEIRSDRMNSVYAFPDEVKKIQQYMSLQNANSPVRAIPAEGVDVPVWILGSSTDSAYVAAALGLPYAFASHFAPAMLSEAISIYKRNFKPSPQLQEPYVMAGVNVLIAASKEEAAFLATSRTQMMVNVIAGTPQLMPPPVKEIEVHPQILQVVNEMLRYSFIGDQQQVHQQLDEFAATHGVDELMVVTNTFDPQARLESFRLLAEISNQVI